MPLTTPPLVTVLVLNWNGLSHTSECLRSLERCTYTNLRVVVVDNGSANNEADQLRSLFAGRISVFAAGHNLGYAGGCNFGLKNIAVTELPDYLLAINNDVVISPDAIEHLVAEAETDSRCAMVAPRLMNYVHRERVDNLGLALTVTGLGFDRKTDRYPLFCPNGAMALYRFSALWQLLGIQGEVWDSDFFAYTEDLDLGFRLRLLGFTAKACPNAVGYHKGGATSGGATSDFSLYQGHRNNLWFVAKDFPSSMLAKHSLGILATQLGTFLLYARRRRLGLLLRAKWSALRGIPRMIMKRRRVLRLRLLTDQQLAAVMIPRAYVSPSST